MQANNNIKQYNSESKECLTKNDKYIDDILSKRDNKLFSLYFSKANNDKDRTRFLYEEFFDLENIKTTKTNPELNEKDKINKSNPFIKLFNHNNNINNS